MKRHSAGALVKSHWDMMVIDKLLLNMIIYEKI
jgi:hypothetical protein